MYKGKLLANVYLSDDMLVIDIETGNVESVIDLSMLSTEIKEAVNDKAYLKKGNVLNGIAYHESTDVLLVTGKNWPIVYQITIPDIPSTHN